jgi:hypothetical protein
MAGTRRGRTAAGRTWRTLRHPLALPLWAGVLLWSMRTLQIQRLRSDSLSLSTLGWLLDSVAGSNAGAPVNDTFEHELYAVRDPGHWRIIDTNVDSADELTRLLSSEPERVVQVNVELVTISSGLVACTARETRDRVTFAPFSSWTPSDDDREQMRRAAVDHAILRFPGPALDNDQVNRVARLRAADTGGSARVWSGYAVNVGLVVGGVMTMLTLARAITATPGWPRRVRNRRRVASGRCVRCAYPVRDLPSGVCPECGTPVSASSPAGSGPGRPSPSGP